MLFSLILVITTIVAWMLGRRSSAWPDHARRGLAAAMVIAGTGHLLGPEPFLQHLPAWVPAREALVFGSGLVEIGLGLALLSPARWVAAGRLLALFLLAVWPANFYVALAGVDVAGQPGGIYPWLRLPLQVLFIGWALWSTRRSVAVAPGEARGAPVTATTISAA